MKKAFALIACLALALACMAPAMAEEIDLKTIMDSNTADALRERYATVGETFTHYDADGNPAQTSTHMIDAENNALFQSAERTEYLNGHDLYIQFNDAEAEFPFTTGIFTSDAAYDSYLNWICSGYFNYYEQEVVVDVSQADGLMIITTEEPVMEERIPKYTEAGFEGVTGVHNVYTFDPSTNDIISSVVSLKLGDELALYITTELQCSDEPISEPDYVAEIKANETRTINVHFEDAVTACTAYQGIPVRTYHVKGYGTYATEDRQPIPENQDLSLDTDIYLLPDEE